MVITRQLTDSASASTASDIQLGSCVTEIGQGAFSGYTNITDVEFPDSLTTIGVGAFSGSSITSVEFPDNLETIGDSAFRECYGLESVEFPDNLETIGDRAFGECYGLETIDIPDSVTTIGNYAFNFPMQGESLIECTIGSGVTTIGNGAFNGNTNMRKLTINATTPPTLGSDALNGNYLIYVPYSSYDDYISASGWVNYKNRIVYNDFPYKAMFLNATGGLENFAPCNSSSALTRDEVVNTITTAVTKVTLGNCINTVGNSSNSVFSGYTSLNEIEFSNSITAITDRAFARTNAHITTLPSSIATIGSYAFSGTDATVKISFDSLTIGNNITSIGYSAFKYCNIGTLNLTSTATTYGNYIFSNTNITNLNIGNTVTKISPYMFDSSSGFTSLTIPNSVATIENDGFYNCDDLKTLTINGNTAIGDYGFGGCSSLSSITMPNVTEIGKSAFRDCSSLEKINPSSTYDAVINLSVIKDWAFDGNAFETLELGANVTSVRGRTFADNTNLKKLHIIGNNSTIFDVEVESSPVSYHGAFENCTALEEIIIDNAYSFNNRNRSVNAFTNCNAIKKITIGSGYSSIDDRLFQGKTSLTSLTLSNGITSIGNSAFSGCTSLPTLDLPSNLQSIGASAFTNCSSISTLIIPDSVISIGNNAFSGCSGLNSILIGRATPPTIGTNVFNGSNCLIYVPQASYDLYVNAENWSSYADRIYAVGQDYKALLIGGTSKVVNCNDNTTLALSEIGSNSAETINIGNCVTTIGANAFTSSYSLEQVIIPSGVTTIESNAFEYCSGLTNCTIPSGVTTINNNTFRRCSGLISIDIPNGVTSIGNNAFETCTSLTSVTIPSGVTSIGSSAFANCNNLPSINIPSGVTSIGNNAFYGCTNLDSITVNATTPPILGYSVFAQTNDCLIYVPCESVSTYKSASGWREYASRIVGIPPCEPQPFSGKWLATYQDTHIEFAECDASSAITENEITKENLISVEIGDCITSIGNKAFEQYWSLTSINIPDSVTTIGYWAFYQCSGITSINIPDSVTSIGNMAFAWCKGLTSIIIPSGVTSIDYDAFYECSSLTSITINAITPPTLGYSVFESSSCPIYVPCESVNAYKAASGWSEYASRIVGIPPCEPPIGERKWLATYSDQHTESAECDASSAIGENEITKENLISVEIGDCVTSIGDSAFYRCTSLTSINIPDSVTSIGYAAFADCSGVTNITIPSGVTSISSYAFADCSGVTSITINAITPPTLGYSVFEGSSCQIYVPCESTYKSASRWSTYASRIQPIPNS